MLPRAQLCDALWVKNERFGDALLGFNAPDAWRPTGEPPKKENALGLVD
jgi:hypothetical protein